MRRQTAEFSDALKRLPRAAVGALLTLQAGLGSAAVAAEAFDVERRWAAAPPSKSTAAAPTPKPAPRSQADLLVEQAYGWLRQGDTIEKGWKEAYEAGVEVARRAIELDRNHADAHYILFCNLGRLASRGGLVFQIRKIRELSKLLDRTLELDPLHAHAWQARGEMLLRLPRWFGGSESEGEASLRRASELAPEWPKPLLDLAELHVENHQLDLARIEAEQALAAAEVAADVESATRAQGILSGIEN